MPAMDEGSGAAAATGINAPDSDAPSPPHSASPQPGRKQQQQQQKRKRPPGDPKRQRPQQQRTQRPDFPPIEVEYVVRDGLRHVVPYVYAFAARAKGRWWGRPVLEVRVHMLHVLGGTSTDCDRVLNPNSSIARSSNRPYPSSYRILLLLSPINPSNRSSRRSSAPTTRPTTRPASARAPSRSTGRR
jgi:hypothetical protein